MVTPLNQKNIFPSELLLFPTLSANPATEISPFPATWKVKSEVWFQLLRSQCSIILTSILKLEQTLPIEMLEGSAS